MHIFMDNFRQGEKDSYQIAMHQEELRREEKLTDQKYSSISSLQTDDLDLDRSSGCGKTARDKIFPIKVHFLLKFQSFCRMFFKSIRKDKGKYCAASDLDKQQTERTPHKCFRCGYVHNLIAKCPKPP